jgi:hypothetical protein
MFIAYPFVTFAALCRTSALRQYDIAFRSITFGFSNADSTRIVSALQLMIGMRQDLLRLP